MMTRDELAGICAEVEFQNWRVVAHPLGRPLLLRIEFDAFDNHDLENDEQVPQHGRWWHIQPKATCSDVVRTIWAAVLMAVEHETREQFKFAGKAIFDPHFCVDCLANGYVEIDAHAVGV